MAAQLEAHGRTRIDRFLRGWRSRLISAAAAWSCLATAVGALWTIGLAASPFGSNDPRVGEVGSYFEGLEPRQTGLVVVAIGLAGIAAAVALRRAPGRLWPAVPAAVLGVVLLVVVPDVRVIQNFAYLFFGYTGLWDGALAAELVSILGGILWLGAAAAQPEVRASRLLTPHEPRWARAAAYTAAALALPYPAVRVSWALGIPLGAPGGELDFGWAERLGIGLVFGGLPTIGAVLTIGLVRRWGEVFPRWIPVLRGRRVPIWFAVVPGSLAAAMTIQMGLRVTTGTVRDIATGDYPWSAWGASLPGAFILPWGLALAAAVYAYAMRRSIREAGDPSCDAIANNSRPFGRQTGRLS